MAKLLFLTGLTWKNRGKWRQQLHNLGKKIKALLTQYKMSEHTGKYVNAENG